MRAEAKPSGLQMMKTSNAWSVMYLAAAVTLTGDIFQFIEFAGRHPSVIYNLVFLGLTSSIGNLFLYSMVLFLFFILIFISTFSDKQNL